MTRQPFLRKANNGKGLTFILPTKTVLTLKILFLFVPTSAFVGDFHKISLLCRRFGLYGLVPKPASKEFKELC